MSPNQLFLRAARPKENKLSTTAPPPQATKAKQVNSMRAARRRSYPQQNNPVDNPHGRPPRFQHRGRNLSRAPGSGKGFLRVGAAKRSGSCSAIGCRPPPFSGANPAGTPVPESGPEPLATPLVAKPEIGRRATDPRPRIGRLSARGRRREICFQPSTPVAPRRKDRATRARNIKLSRVLWSGTISAAQGQP